MSRRIITIDVEQAGQLARYADSQWRARLSIEDPDRHKSLGPARLTPEQAKLLMREFVRSFQDVPEFWSSPHLTKCQANQDGSWTLEVTEAYTD